VTACMCILERGGERQRSVYLLKACLTGSLKRIPQLQRYCCSSLIRADLIAETDMKNFPDHPVCVRQDSFSVLYVGQCLVKEELMQDQMKQEAHSLVPDLYRHFSVTMNIGRQDSSNRSGIRLSDPCVWC
jgi:hypothetical protein